jgi:hypothetical protein
LQGIETTIKEEVKMSIKEENVIREYVSIGETPSAGVFRVNRSFYMKVRNGPLVLVKAGQRVELGKTTRDELFSIGKIQPEKIPEKFTVRVPFRTVINDLYVDLRIGDIIELSPEEALKYWRQGFVSPIQEEV